MMPEVQKTYIAVPVLDAARCWPLFSVALNQNLKDLGMNPDHVLILDSESTDATLALAEAAGYRTHTIRRADFDHGGSRQVAAELLNEADILVYLTQDAILAHASSIRTLLAAFSDTTIGTAYGRQLPRDGASPREAFGRYFSYPDRSMVRDMSMCHMGFRSICSSNSFCAYRRHALMQVGGFSRRTICSEEVIVTAKMHMAGYRSAYVADALVKHSHNYTAAEEFRRYFDIGSCHGRERWMLESFGGPSGEGLKFVLAEIKYLLKEAPLAIPGTILRTGCKLVAYRIGKASWTPLAWRKKWSMNKGFWHQQELDSARIRLHGAEKIPVDAGFDATVSTSAREISS